MISPLPDPSLEQMFTQARSHNVLGGSVDDATLKRLYELVKWGPTAANASPARFVFVRTPEAKKRLEPLLDEGNRSKTMASPATVIVGHDVDFAQRLPFLFPHTDAKAWFEGVDEAVLDRVALQNASLQGGYLILAARALGLDVGPMTGFDAQRVSEEFFPDSRVRANLMVNLGYGDPAALFPRSPRLPFDEAARII